jgi:hypothetical protein
MRDGRAVCAAVLAEIAAKRLFKKPQIIGMTRKSPPRLGRLDRQRTDQQGGAHAVLKGADALRHGRGRDIQRRRGGVERSGAQDCG